MATDSRYIVTKAGVHELFPVTRRDGSIGMESRFCWSKAVARGAMRNDIGDRDLEALSVRANAGNRIAKRAMEMLERDETLTDAWRRQVAQLIA